MEHPPIELRHLRKALTFAVHVAAEGHKKKLPMKCPPELRKFAGQSPIPNQALKSIRRSLEGDEQFRTLLAAGATPELVDPIGVLWIARPEGWQDEVAALIAAEAAVSAGKKSANDMKQSDKRRDAAEQASARLRTEAIALQDRLGRRDETIAGLAAKVAELTDSLAALKHELAETKSELRHGKDREQAAVAKLVQGAAKPEAGNPAVIDAESLGVALLAEQAAARVERSTLARLASDAARIAEQLSALVAPAQVEAPSRVAKRKPLALPKGVMGDSEIVAKHLLNSGAMVIVDGYNVAMLGWPALDLVGQRNTLLDVLENVAKRFLAEYAVVFDGTDVVGAAADRRREVRVVFSPAGVIADDVIRDEVRRQPHDRQIIVVTADKQIVNDVKALGANTMSNAQFLDAVR